MMQVTGCRITEGREHGAWSIGQRTKIQDARFMMQDSIEHGAKIQDANYRWSVISDRLSANEHRTRIDADNRRNMRIAGR